MTLSAGTRLGPYEILAAIGAGGMGEVYKARDTRLDRTVAIKILPAQVSADPERRARFEREAKTIAGLNHPHICTLHDVGQHEGSTFLVMEHLTGETLAQRLEKGPLEQALAVATEIADALSAAHRQGVVHRDLKPGNVMLTKAGAKLLDFGLAKLKGHGEHAAAAHLESAPTQSTPLELQHETGKPWPFFRDAARDMMWPRIEQQYRDELQGITEGLGAKGVAMDLWDLVALNGRLEWSCYAAECDRLRGGHSDAQ